MLQERNPSIAMRGARIRHHDRCRPREEMMAEVQEMRGEKIYECDFNITGVTDYGVTLDAVLSGKEKVPLQGARFDVAFEGDSKGRLTAKYVASNTFYCVPTDALTSAAEPRLKPKTGIGSPCTLR